MQQSEIFKDVWFPCVLSSYYTHPSDTMPWVPFKGDNTFLCQNDADLEARLNDFNKVCSYDGFYYDFKIETSYVINGETVTVVINEIRQARIAFEEEERKRAKLEHSYVIQPEGYAEKKQREREEAIAIVRFLDQIGMNNHKSIF